MPVRSTIHWSVVSAVAVESALVRTFSGTCQTGTDDLSAGDRDCGGLPNATQAVGALGADRVLKEEEAVRLERVRQFDRLGRVEPRVDVQADLDVVAEVLAATWHPTARRLTPS